MTTNLDQCKDCIHHHFLAEGDDMCKMIGDDHFLEWKVENCWEYKKDSNVKSAKENIK